MEVFKSQIRVLCENWLHPCCLHVVPVSSSSAETLTSLSQIINYTELVRAAIQGKLSQHI